MDLNDLGDELAPGTEALQEAVREADVVNPVGARTQWDVGGPVEPGREVASPSGGLRHDPADLTVTLGAGTPVSRLDEVLATHGQETPLDPHDPEATVGGVLACGLSGPRRLRHGPLRDRVLEVVLVTGDGRLVRGGGPTVKNVTGFDLPRLVVGSLGTLGVLVRVTLRCQPRPAVQQWAVGEGYPGELRRRLFRPSSLLWDGQNVWALLEGYESDVEAEIERGGLRPVDSGPRRPEDRCRGRVSVRPGALPSVCQGLERVEGVTWLGEVGVGTVHVAGPDGSAMEAARSVAAAGGGWLLREGGDGFDPYGTGPTAPGVAGRLREAFDPRGILNPGRVPW